MGKTRRIQSDAPIGEPNEDINDPRFAPYRYARSSTINAHVSSDDPVPLFLSGHETQSSENFLALDQRKAISPSRIVIGLLAAAAVATVFALFSVDPLRAVVINAKASLASASSSKSDPAPLDSAQASAPTAQLTTAAANPLPQAPAADSAQATSSLAFMPTREEIFAAYQSALQQNQATTAAPAAVAPTAIAPTAIPPPARRLNPDELASLLKRAKGLLAIGDIASARLLLERAADAQEASAALMLARTYDPAVLGTPDARSVTPDPAQARIWYRKAAEFGSQDAQQRLAQMQN
jgi:TPR repeat protein